MKNIILASLFALISLLLHAQHSHLSKHFDLTKQIVLSEYTKEEQSKELVGYGDEQKIYFCKKRAFQNKESNFDALVYVIDYTNNIQTTLTLPFPENKRSAGNARKYWIYGIAAYDNMIILSTQTANLLYRYEKGAWKLQNSLSVTNSDFSWLYQNHIYTLSEDNNYGYNLWRADVKETSMNRICEFKLRAYFLLQYGPNGFIKPDQTGNLYFINTPDMVLHKYDLNGKLLARCPIDIPSWQSMPSDYITQTNAMPYSSDRAMYAYYHSAKYSFPLEIIPLNGNTFILSYHHYDTLRQKESLELLFLKISTDWTHAEYEQCLTTFSPDKVISMEAFPIYYHQPELCLSVTIPNGLAQISKESMIDYLGMTGSEYAQAKEQYLKHHRPIFTLNIIKLKQDY